MRFSFHVIMVSILKWLFLVLSDRIPGVTTITSGTRLFISRGMPTDFSQMKNKGVVSNYYGTSFCWSIMNKHILFYSLYQSITLIRKLFWYPKLKNKKTKNPQVIESSLLAGSHWDLFIHGLIQFQKSALLNKKWLIYIEELLNVTQDSVTTVRLKMHYNAQQLSGWWGREKGERDHERK